MPWSWWKREVCSVPAGPGGGTSAPERSVVSIPKASNSSSSPLRSRLISGTTSVKVRTKASTAFCRITVTSSPLAAYLFFLRFDLLAAGVLAGLLDLRFRLRLTRGGPVLAPFLLAAPLALTMARFGGSIVWVFSTVLLQLATEDRYRGRVFAAETSLFTLTMMLSNVGVGRAIDDFHVSPFAMAWLMGAISLVCGICWLGGLTAWAATRSVKAVVQAGSDGE